MINLFREEIYTDLIQEYDHLSHEEVTDIEKRDSMTVT